jgi:hypothetical protein
VQTSFVAHGTPVPQRQAPEASHVSALAPQATQAAPAAPHWAVERVTHVIPAQQPEGHTVASQTQAPLTQRWPVGHAGPLPHWQVPPTQAFAVCPHETQARPMVLHDESAGLMQLPAAEQHPPGHDVPSQTQTPAAQR